MNVAIVGSGYVGLITGLCLASQGNNVRCIDLNKLIINKINSGEPHFYEKGLKSLLKNQLETKRFKSFFSLNELDIEVEMIIIAVGTPSDINGDIDLEYIINSCKLIGKYLRKSKKHISVVVKSTVLPGTTDTLVKNILEKESFKCVGEFGIGMNPGFLREGSAIEDFMNPDRIIIGFEDQTTKIKLQNLYKNWDCAKMLVNTRTAEFIKYTNNCFLALQISAANEIANLAYEIGNVDIKEIMHGVHLDKRWSPIIDNKRINPGILNYLKAGCGFGGSCFPKDIKAIRNLGLKKGLNMKVLTSIIEVNDLQPLKILRMIKEINNFQEMNILVLGLSFKENTDDVRESPALAIIPKLRDSINKIYLHDPIATDNFKKELGNFEELKYINNWELCLKSCHIILLLTNWLEYKKLENMNLEDKFIIDPRRILNKKIIKVKKYFTVGQK